MVFTPLLNRKLIRVSLQPAKIKRGLRFASIVSLLMFAFTISTNESASVSLTKRTTQVPLVVLESSEGALNQGSLSRTLAASKDAQVVYTLGFGTEEVVAHETQLKSARRFRLSVPPQTVEAFAMGPEGNIYIIDSVSSQIRILNPAGQPLSVVPKLRPISLGILGNGNMVVASAEGPNLVHIHGPTGSKLASFGQLRSLDIHNALQNRFLNQGKIAIGPSDTVYYVSRYAPVPTVQKFSTAGQLLSEVVVAGAAIDHQVSIANDFLRKKEPGLVGGFDIITSATVDPSSGHLWISMNGTSKDGVVYEYDRDGIKLREYGFVVKGVQRHSDRITGIKDLVVRAPWIYLLAPEGRLYRFNLNNVMSDDE